MVYRCVPWPNVVFFSVSFIILDDNTSSIDSQSNFALLVNHLLGISHIYWYLDTWKNI